MRRLLLLCFLLSACSIPGRTCAESNQEYTKELSDLMQEWQDASTLAGSTPRMQLATQIANLQGVRRKAQALEAPECGEAAKLALISAMDSTIEGFTAFLGQQPEGVVNAKFIESAQSFQEATEELIKMRAPPE